MLALNCFSHALICIAVLSMGLFIPAAAPGAIEYTVIDMGFLSGDDGAIATGLNEKGEAVGFSQTNAPVARAFYWSEETGMQDLKKLGNDADDYYATRINNEGVAIGYALHSNPFHSKGTVWSGGVVSEIPPNPDPTPTLSLNDINQKGTICGSTDEDGFQRAMRYSSGQMTLIPMPHPYIRSSAFGLNDLDHCVGYVLTNNYSETRGFVFKISTQLIPTLGGTYNSAADINNNGWIVGSSQISGDTETHAFVWDGVNPPVDLGTFGGSQSLATSINDSNVVVGVGNLPGDTDLTAFIYKGGVVTELNGLIDPASGWDIKRAEFINNKGQIAGAGIKNGEVRAIMLNPIPAPGVAADYTFTGSSEGWTATTSIPPFQDGTASTPAGALALSPNGNFPVFAFWLSPGIPVEAGKTYEASFTITSTVLNTNDVPQFRMRVNQNGTNLATIVAVDSEMGAAPTTGVDRIYKTTFTPFDTGGPLEVRLALDLTHFNPFDNASGAILMKDAKVVEVEE